MTNIDPKAWRLEELLGSITLDEFWSRYDDRTHLKLKAAVAPGQARAAFSLSSFDEVVAAYNLAFPQIEVIREGEIEAPPVSGDASRLDVVGLASLLRKGASIRLRGVHNFYRGVAQVCTLLADGFGESLSANAYFTPHDQAGFRPHFDDHDVWILQTHGSKVWRIYEGGAANPVRPFPGQRFDEALHCVGNVVDEFVLDPGDMLYIPRGTMHAARSTKDGSLHITFGVNSVTFADVMHACVEELRRSDPSARAKVQHLHASNDELRSAAIAQAFSSFGLSLTAEQMRSVEDHLLRSFLKRCQPSLEGAISATATAADDGASERYRLQNTRVWRKRRTTTGVDLELSDMSLSMTNDEFRHFSARWDGSEHDGQEGDDQHRAFERSLYEVGLFAAI